MRRVEELSAQVSRMKRRAKDRGKDEHSQNPRAKIIPRWQTLYRINNGIHLREPSWIDAQYGYFELKGDTPISNLNAYLKRHDDIVFVPFKDYDNGTKLSAATELAEDDFLPQPQPSTEAVILTSAQMVSVMKKFLNAISGFKESFPDFDPTKEIHEPYLFWFFYRTNMEEALRSLSAEERTMIKLFRDWIEGSYGEEWDYIDSEFEKGMVCPISVKYLIRPGDVLVSRKDENIDAYIIKTWPKFLEPRSSQDKNIDARIAGHWPNSFKPNSRKDGNIDVYTSKVRPLPLESKTHKDRLQGRAKLPASGIQPNNQDTTKSEVLGQNVAREDYLWNIEAWSWSFDGEFRRATAVLDLKITAPTDRSRVPITSLEVFPLKYDETGLEARLKKRGEIFWKCRKRYLVSCVDSYEEDMSVVSFTFWCVDIYSLRHRMVTDTWSMWLLTLNIDGKSTRKVNLRVYRTPKTIQKTWL